MVNFFRGFYRDTDRRCFVQISWIFVRREIDEIVRYLVDKNKFRLFLKLSLLCLCGSRQPQQYTQSAPDYIQIGSHSAEL